jgi:putative salt-induced outer membrane protein YdiY
MRYWRFFLLILTGWVAATAVHAQQIAIELKNGDKITGRIIREEKQELVIFTPWKAEITIPLDEIKSRQIVAQAFVNPTNQARATQPTIAVPATPPIASPPGPKPKPSQQWHGDLQLGTDLTFGEKNRQLYYGRAKLLYSRELFKNRILKNVFDFSGTYGRTEGIVSDHRLDSSLKSDLDIGGKWYTYNQGAAGYDKIRRINLRYEVGPGFGYHLIARSNIVLNTELGMNYQAREFEGGSTEEQFFFRLAEDFNWRISNKFSFDEKLEMLPSANFAEFRVRFEANLRYWLLQNLSINLTVLDLYDSNPAQNISKNDLQIRSSVGVKF